MGDAACGCEAAKDNGAECDCEMQDACYCDGDCRCSANVCKNAEH